MQRGSPYEGFGCQTRTVGCWRGKAEAPPEVERDLQAFL